MEKNRSVFFFRIKIDYITYMLRLYDSYVSYAVEYGLTKYYSPEFNGKNSFLSIPLAEDLRRSTRLEIWFGTTSDTGLLLYSGQSYTGQGDFISIYLSDGHVRLTYDLGNGKTNIT